MNSAQHIIHLFTPLMAGLDALCIIVLLSGGWLRPNESRVRPTRIQVCLAVSLFFAMVYFLLEAITQEWSIALTNKWRLVLDWLSDMTLAGFVLQSVLLRQQPIRRKEWLLVLVPTLLSLLIILVWGDSHPLLARYSGYALYTYIIIMYGFGLWRLRMWDRHIEEEYSDIAHKQTHWYRKLTAPIMLLVLLWIPAELLPHGEWVWVVYYPLLAVITIYTTSYGLEQEEWEINVDETPQSGYVNENETEQSSYENENVEPVWAERLEKLMSEKHLYRNPELTLSTLALELGINRTYLSQYINQVRKTSFYQYVNEYRLHEAETLLRDTDETVDEIAAACGFSSANVFRRTFRDKHGIAPSDWRKQNC